MTVAEKLAELRARVDDSNEYGLDALDVSLREANALLDVAEAAAETSACAARPYGVEAPDFWGAMYGLRAALERLAETGGE